MLTTTAYRPPMLHDFLTSNHGELISRCREKVAKRTPELGTADDNGVPVFLAQLADILYREQLPTSRHFYDPEPTPASTEIGRAAALHGATMLRSGYTVDQVVHDYGDVCQAVTELAAEQHAPVSINEFRILNRCLDNAIAEAVTVFARDPDGSNPEQAESSRQRVFSASEQRRLVHLAIQALAAIRTGNIGLSGATGTLLVNTLLELRDLVGQSSPVVSRPSVTGKRSYNYKVHIKEPEV